MSNDRTSTNDWQVTSYGDLGAFAGIGARVSHHKFYSPKLNKKVNTVFIEVGLGAGVDFKLPQIEKINNAIKLYDAANAESGYKKLICHRAFSAADISGALGDCESGSLVLGDGCKMIRIAARGNGLGPAGKSLLFTLPVARTPVPGTNGQRTAAGEKGYGASVEASVTAGVFIKLSDDYLRDHGRRTYENSNNGIIYRPHPGKA
jgi:hypothetical protein